MQLDNTQIAIRERGFADILDLGLRVVATHLGPLLVAMLAGIIPFALLNDWLLADLLPLEEDTDGLSSEYLWALFVLMIWQTPVATTPLTLYLGQALFVSRPSLREMLRAFWSRLPQLIALQVIGRGFLAYFCVRAILHEASAGTQTLLGLLLVGQWFFLHLLWPYSNEVLLLERNPLRRGKAPAGTIGRILALHGQATSEVVLRWLMSFLIGWVLVGAYAFSALMAVEFVLFDFGSERYFLALYLPLAGWLVIGYFAVVRFLGYLDLRIRTEGWEVRLLMRAEGARIARQLA
jgi:hypothetical protein